MAVITTIRSAFGFLTRLPVGPWPLQNDLNGICLLYTSDAADEL